MDESPFELSPPEPTAWERFSRKFKREPLVPLGAGLTVIALVGASRSLKKGQSKQFNVWLRYRVLFQGLTVLAALGGSVYYTNSLPLPVQPTPDAIAERKEAERADRIRRAEESESSHVVDESSRKRGWMVRSVTSEEKDAMRLESEGKRADMRKAMAKAAKDEGRALRLPQDADFVRRGDDRDR